MDLAYLPETLEQNISELPDGAVERAAIRSESSPKFGHLTCLLEINQGGTHTWCLDSQDIVVRATNQFWWDSVDLVQFSSEVPASVFRPEARLHGTIRLGNLM
jgi:hypothetical protein